MTYAYKFNSHTDPKSVNNTILLSRENFINDTIHVIVPHTGAWQAFSVKNQIGSICSAVGHVISVTTLQL